MNNVCKIILLITSSALFSACAKQEESAAAPPIRSVKTLQVTTGDTNTWVELPGVVEAARKAELSFRVAGKLKQLFVKEGDRVAKDQLLAKLDATDYEIQLKSRKAEYDKADADFRRAEKLTKAGSISHSDYEKLQAQRETSAAALAAAQQNVAYTFLKAPFSGRIAKRHVENFEEIRAKQEIFSLQDPDAFTIKVDVPESIMIHTREGGKPEVYAVFTEIPQRKFPLSMQEVSTQADAQTNTYTVSFAMPRVADLNILPGMSVAVRANPDHQKNSAQGAIHIPAHAVMEDSQGRFVYLVKRQKETGEAQGKNRGVVEKRRVTIGELSGSKLIISQGLQVGDEVITAGMSKMSEGLEVRLSPGQAQ